MTKVRTRFAPSPTGFMHVGGIRTALFAWLVARQADGSFILRIEDTDKSREVAGAEAHIVKCLKALNLNYDEGPDKSGEFGPYRQSERLATYKKWGKKLIELGRAYADPYSSSEVEKFREQAKQDKQAFLYRNHRPENPPKWDGAKPLRFKSVPKAYSWEDAVMGDLTSGPEVVDDFILIKSDGFPTYNFAHIVDDLEMEVSHVIRGQEFLASVPNYLNLYEALGVNHPILATLPHILAPDGKKKLSKRDGAKDVLDYISEGYLPDALINFIASLGWNDGTEQEIYSPEELIAKFDLNHVQKSGARFDEQRLNWMNGHYIRALDNETLLKLAANYWPTESSKFEDRYKIEVLALLKDRLKHFSELTQLSRFFFVDLPIKPELIKDNKNLSKLSDTQLIDLLDSSLDVLQKCQFEIDEISKCLNDLLVETNQTPGVLFSLIRIATTQAPSSPGLAESIYVLGKETCLRRIKALIDFLNK